MKSTFVVLILFLHSCLNPCFAAPDDDCIYLASEVSPDDISDEVIARREPLKRFINRLGDFNSDAPTNKSRFYYALRAGEYDKALATPAFYDNIQRMAAYKPSFSGLRVEAYLALWLKNNGLSSPKENIEALIIQKISNLYSAKLPGAPERSNQEIDVEYALAMERFAKEVSTESEFSIRIVDYVEEFLQGGKQSRFGIEYTEPDLTKLTVVYEVNQIFRGSKKRYVVSHVTDHIDYQGFQEGDFWNSAVDFNPVSYDGLKVTRLSNDSDKVGFHSTFVYHDKGQNPFELTMQSETEKIVNPMRGTGWMLSSTPAWPNRMVVIEVRRLNEGINPVVGVASLLTGRSKPLLSAKSLRDTGLDGAPGLSIILLQDHKQILSGKIWLPEISNQSGVITYSTISGPYKIQVKAHILKGTYELEIKKSGLLAPLGFTWSALFQS